MQSGQSRVCLAVSQRQLLSKSRHLTSTAFLSYAHPNCHAPNEIPPPPSGLGSPAGSIPADSPPSWTTTLSLVLYPPHWPALCSQTCPAHFWPRAFALTVPWPTTLSPPTPTPHVFSLSLRLDCHFIADTIPDPPSQSVPGLTLIPCIRTCRENLILFCLLACLSNSHTTKQVPEGREHTGLACLWLYPQY